MKRSSPALRLRPHLLAPLHGRRALVAQLVFWSLLEALPAFLTGHLVARSVDSGFGAGRPVVGLAWLAALGLSVFAGAWAARRAVPLLAAVVEPFRDGLVRRVTSGALHGAADGRGGGRADASGIAGLTRQVEMVRESYASIVMVLRGFAFTMGGALLGLASLSPLMLSLVAPPLLAGLLLFVALLRPMAARQREVLLAEERLATAGGEVAAGLRDVAACGAEGEIHAAVGRHIDAHAHAARRLARTVSLRALATAISGWTPLLALLFAAPWLIRNGATDGAVLGAVTYVVQGMQPALRTLVQGLGSSGLRLVVGLRRILEAAEDGGAVEPGAPGAPGAPQPLSPAPASVELALRDVTFAYGAQAEPVVRGLSLELGRDDHLAVVGPSGIGKSTLAGLVTGMLTPDAGDVLLNGQPPAARSPQERARQRVLIPQEAYVFTGSVEENLTYLRPDAEPEMLDHAIEVLGARRLIDRLGGVRATLTPAALSAGERQRLALVRAYLSPAPLAVLDEATCHLDPEAEARAEAAFAERSGSLIVIAHRISSALRARRILVLDGVGIACGSHVELLRESVLYRDLVGLWQSPVERPGGPVPVTSSPPRARP